MSTDPSRRQLLAGSALLGTAALAGPVTNTVGADVSTSELSEPGERSGHNGSGRSGPTTATLHAQQDEAELDLKLDPDAVESFVDDTLDTALDEHDIVGASVAVVHEDEAILTKGYGVADADTDEPVDAGETRFRIGSVSKPIVWTAAMQLIEDGQLDPHEDVTTYLDSVSIPETDAEPITMAHLATHTAGFEERFQGTWVTDPDDMRDLPTVLSDEQPARVRPSGEVIAYSNYGTALAAQVVADIAGTPFEQYARENVFDPLSMTQSSFTQPFPDEAASASTATGYSTLLGSPQEAPGLLVEFTPAGSMTASATDMAQFMRAQLGDGSLGTDDSRVLESESIAQLQEQWFTHHDELDGFTFGFIEGTIGPQAHRTLEHNGHIPGSFYSDLWLVPAADLGVFVTYNTDSGAVASGEFREAFAAEFLPVAEDEPTPGEPDGPPARADELEGTFRSVRVVETTMGKLPSTVQAASADVRIDNDGFLVTDFGGGPDRWVEVEPLRFEAVEGDTQLAFGERDGDVRYLFLDFQAFERQPWHESLSLHGGVAGATMLGMLSGAVGWPLARGWRRFRSDSDGSGGGGDSGSENEISDATTGEADTDSAASAPSGAADTESPSETQQIDDSAASSTAGSDSASPESDGDSSASVAEESQSKSVSQPQTRTQSQIQSSQSSTPLHNAGWARWVAGGSIGALFGFLAGTVVLYLLQPYTLLSSPPTSFQLLAVLPLVGALGTVVAAGYAVQSWRLSWWTLRSRVHYTLVVLATAVFCLLLGYWNLLTIPL
ncbi:beta-lactamase [Natrialba chahannaoensis JCM 10990]|uniref:Beta-lactamase n=1 Tax=Natrialba chahannaoensis JCM 10990 TaxID=1227492 RepID=M0A6G4_9EURY|nr:serine hydrolase domain-containing protein [Natrialba chahannaoensis]ELY94355.1 beta-lactamase [Natrialba chahannaoensis JCM 10990]